ncbi:MAG TPA: crotonase/enoyl-CoA hydratase family protein [Solirubrobacterales bacterium]|nr:crotonase/enoyl-CoA hydratase family protein [Solirubrobacterales bacterium]
MAGSGTPVRSERHGRTLVIVLARPQARNAVNQAMAEGIAAALETLDADPELAVGVIWGEGPGFSAGMDLREIQQGGRSSVGERGFAGIVRHSSEKPLIAAIEGFALAGGLEVALACDLIVAGAGARLGLPEAQRSLVAIGGALLRLPRRVPWGLASELALTGEPISAERGYEAGLVDRIAPPGEALAVALELAAAIGRNGPAAVRASKRVLREQLDWPEAEFWDRQAEIAEPVMRSEDAMEGARAFVERREPKWRGS